MNQDPTGCLGLDLSVGLILRGKKLSLAEIGKQHGWHCLKDCSKALVSAVERQNPQS